MISKTISMPILKLFELSHRRFLYFFVVFIYFIQVLLTTFDNNGHYFFCRGAVFESMSDVLPPRNLDRQIYPFHDPLSPYSPSQPLSPYSPSQPLSPYSPSDPLSPSSPVNSWSSSSQRRQKVVTHGSRRDPTPNSPTTLFSKSERLSKKSPVESSKRNLNPLVISSPHAGSIIPTDDEYSMIMVGKKTTKKGQTEQEGEKENMDQQGRKKSLSKTAKKKGILKVVDDSQSKKSFDSVKPSSKRKSSKMAIKRVTFSLPVDGGNGGSFKKSSRSASASKRIESPLKKQKSLLKSRSFSSLDPSVLPSVEDFRDNCESDDPYDRMETEDRLNEWFARHGNPIKKLIHEKFFDVLDLDYGMLFQMIKEFFQSLFREYLPLLESPNPAFRNYLLNLVTAELLSIGITLDESKLFYHVSKSLNDALSEKGFMMD